MTPFFERLTKKHAAAVFLTLAVLVTLAAFVFNLGRDKAVYARAGNSGPTLVIDAGHGGIDGGAIGVDGSRESDINLSIALKLQAACDFFGKKTVMTRVDDSRGANALTYSEHAELVYRTELVNSTNNAVLLSIHQNCFPTAQPSGPQVLYSDDEPSKRFGNIVHDNLIRCLYPESRRLAEPDRNNIYVLNNVNCPAILVECGFVSNHSDITKLTDMKYQTALSTVLFASFMQYINNTSRL
ncbi:MAG: N-acetylmuramoyl-L-alanine amidase [Oscillospiraceae bacterium]|nr:N-acetylmuramoyl-L-alanine amidase [Oscillospiraceae bacterium]